MRERPSFDEACLCVVSAAWNKEAQRKQRHNFEFRLFKIVSKFAKGGLGYGGSGDRREYKMIIYFME